VHCSFLVRVGPSGPYSYLVLDGCKDATPNQIALRQWMQSVGSEHGITASNFQETVRKRKLNQEVWVKFPHMVSIIEQQFLIKLAEVSKGTKTLIAEPGRCLMSVQPQFLERPE